MEPEPWAGDETPPDASRGSEPDREGVPAEAERIEPIPAPEMIEVDLSEALAALFSETVAPVLPVASGTSSPAEVAGAPHASEGERPVDQSPEADLEHLFGRLRGEGQRSSDREFAVRQFAQAQVSLRLGLVEEARESLKIAVRSPAVRFDAASLLGRLARDSGDAAGAVDWFERAAEAPAPSPSAGQALLYELGDTLEGLGERARALAVFIELHSSAPEYRDVAQRVEWLSGPRARS